MKKLRKIGKIEAGVLGMIIVMTGLVSAGAMSRELAIGAGPSGQSFEWIDEDVYIDGKVKPDSTSLVFDENNIPHIFFITKDNQLKHSVKLLNDWVDETLDAEVTGKYVSAKIDSNGVFHISYGKDNLIYLTGNSNGWQNPVVVDPEMCLTEQCFVSLDLDSNDKPHISYYDGVNKDLKYAFKDDPKFALKSTEKIWDVTVVDSAGKVGRSNSIVVDSQDGIHIAYYDESNTDLKYAVKSDDNFEIMVVDTSNKFGYYASIAVDENDLPHIAHSGVKGVKHSFMINSEDWVDEIVDSDQTQSFYTSMIIDEDQIIHIGYSKTAPGGPNLKFDLMYAKKVNGQWNIETAIDAEPFQFLAFGVSLNLDSDNNPRMSYVDFILDKSLEFVYRTS